MATQTEFITSRISKQTAAAVRKIARTKQWTVSQVIRLLIEKALESK